ncbi:hypothetical protein FE784_00075 [Paenibacillus hemerocallicola]|uniref:Uncharacterized protein n=1 Tax=Paenibacillus hemerocallicola TaxID=1172614 RepID=A0A5C4TGC3_9BACL|nr:hypothetical protein [Paenibacillus hemerocallicola]TNJ68101.1 hypothetical protein FE784_00075 [Paenibacillus hemerocallicola]
MILCVELCEDDYDNYIDFSESNLVFNAPFETMKSFNAWGITVLQGANCLKQIRQVVYLPDNKDFYISGFTEVSFKEIRSGSISIALYKDNLGEGFIKDSNNNIVKINKEWRSTDQTNFFQYEFCGVTDWPHGQGELKINAEGRPSLAVETDFIVTTGEYILNVDKFGFKR